MRSGSHDPSGNLSASEIAWENKTKTLKNICYLWMTLFFLHFNMKTHHSEKPFFLIWSENRKVWCNIRFNCTLICWDWDTWCSLNIQLPGSETRKCFHCFHSAWSSVPFSITPLNISSSTNKKSKPRKHWLFIRFETCFSPGQSSLNNVSC